MVVRTNPVESTEQLLPFSTSKMLKTSEVLNTLWSKHQLAIFIGLIGYLALVQVLRYRRMTKIEALFAHGKRKLSTMTTKEAHEIIAQLQELEFPYAFGKARKIALLKVQL